MDIQRLLQILEAARGYPLTREQESIVRHPGGPGWVLAGPGTGKTEVLTVMLLRLLYVGGDAIQQAPVDPESIFVTTFTEKAARNLEDRLATMRSYVVTAEPPLEEVDISKLRINTLHGLCNEILQEFRASNYQNVRLMDDFEQGMFIYENMDIVKRSSDARDVPFWTEFEFLFHPYVWQAQYRNCPRKWAMAKAIAKVFNRLVEDRIDIDALRTAGGQKERLANLYQEYDQLLKDNFRCDFTHLQARFIDFLGTAVGQNFLDGIGPESKGIQWVLVDEYQDTNRIQEDIYMALANRGKKNLLIVGDDDQAMYRFRGGSVECMVTFDDAVQVFLGISPSSVMKYPLSTNFRSHPDIVQFCDDYITSFPIMNQPDVRVPGKPSLSAGSAITGSYPAVATLETSRVKDLYPRFADTVKGLIENRIVSDPNQCCLLLMSTKETDRNAGPYVQALKNVGLEVYNPRNKAFLEQEEVQCLIGSILKIVDPDEEHVPTNQMGRKAGQMKYPMIQECRDAFKTSASSSLDQYVDNVVRKIKRAPISKYLDSSLHEIVYLLLGLEPFRAWLTDPVRRIRLGKITQLIEAYSSLPVPGYPDLSRGNLRISRRNSGVLVPGWIRQFYHLFIGYLSDAGIDDVEDDDVICPPGMVPVMTMHQAKGLEFPFVFVGHVGNDSKVSDSHKLEDFFDPYPLNPARTFTRGTEEDRANLDLIRQFFVAYSRAQYALIIMGGKDHFKKGRIPCGPTKNWLRRKVINI